MAGTRASYGGRSHPKGPLVRSASLGMPPCRPPSSPLQGRLQAGPETYGHYPQTAGESSQMTEMAGVMSYVMVSGVEETGEEELPAGGQTGKM